MPMDDMISRSAVKAMFATKPPDYYSTAYILDSIDSIPAIDPETRARGKWVWDDDVYHCSKCFFHAYGNTLEILSEEYYYCPSCGAKMEVSG